MAKVDAKALSIPVRTPAGELSPAFERLFLAEYRRVVAIAARVLGDTDRAEDVAQDAFVALYKGHGAEASFAPAWLHKAAVHLALNALRAGARRATREEATAVLEGPRAAADPADVAIVEEERREARAVLARLPERSAALLVLRYSGLSYAEVGAALGINANSIGTLLRRAEDAFRKEMGHED